MNEITEYTGRKVTDWKALIAAAGLFSSAVYFAGTLFHEHVLSDVRQLISEHTTAATTNRAQFFKDIESDARGAVGRIGDMERNCAVVQKQLSSIESRLDGLDRWHTECGRKMAGVEQYMARDASDIRDLEQDVKILQDLVSRGQRK